MEERFHGFGHQAITEEERGNLTLPGGLTK